MAGITVFYNFSQMVGMEVSRIEQEHSMLQYSYDGNIYEVRKLLNYGVNPNCETEYGMTPICFAAENGHKDIVYMLARSGAKVNHKSASHNAPLHLAASRGHAGVVKILLEHNAKVNILTKTNWTPAHWAVLYGYSDVLAILLQYHALLDLKNNFGKSTKDLAVQFMNPTIMKLIEDEEDRIAESRNLKNVTSRIVNLITISIDYFNPPNLITYKRK